MDQYSELNYDIRKKFLYPAIEKIVKDNMIGRNSLLDYGCGPGDLTPRLVSGFDRMVLTDTSSAALELSRKRFPENVQCSFAGLVKGLSGCFSIATVLVAGH